MQRGLANDIAGDRIVVIGDHIVVAHLGNYGVGCNHEAGLGPRPTGESAIKRGAAIDVCYRDRVVVVVAVKPPGFAGNANEIVGVGVDLVLGLNRLGN